MTRAYLAGRRYLEEKKEQGRPNIDNNVATVATLNSKNGSTRQLIA